MTITNILSRTRNSAAKMPILLLALLPVPPKVTGKSTHINEAQRQTNADTLRAVFNLVLPPLQPVAPEGTNGNGLCGRQNTPLFSHFVGLDRGSC